MTILTTRPEKQAGALQTALAKAGLCSKNLPSLSIHADKTSDQYQAALDHWPQATGVIFTSSNAIDHSIEDWQPNTSGTKYYCVGPATKATLAHYGISGEPLPLHFSSEGLLALPALQNVKGQTWIIVTGHRSKPLLAQALKQRGADVLIAPCYRRTCFTWQATDWQMLTNSSIETVVSTSQESFACLLQQCNQPKKLAWLLSKKLLVINPMMQAIALRQGFLSPRILLASNASTAAIVKCLTDTLT